MMTMMKIISPIFLIIFSQQKPKRIEKIFGFNISPLLLKLCVFSIHSRIQFRNFQFYSFLFSLTKTKIKTYVYSSLPLNYLNQKKRENQSYNE